MRTISWTDRQHYALVKQQFLLSVGQRTKNSSRESGLGCLFDSALGARPVSLSQEPLCPLLGVPHSDYWEVSQRSVCGENGKAPAVFSGEYPGFRLTEADLKSVNCQPRGVFYQLLIYFPFLFLIQGKAKGSLGQIVDPCPKGNFAPKPSFLSTLKIRIEQKYLPWKRKRIKLDLGHFPAGELLLLHSLLFILCFLMFFVAPVAPGDQHPQ